MTNLRSASFSARFCLNISPNWVQNGHIAGTTGQSRPIEAIEISVSGVLSSISSPNPVFTHHTFSVNTTLPAYGVHVGSPISFEKNDSVTINYSSFVNSANFTIGLQNIQNNTYHSFPMKANGPEIVRIPVSGNYRLRIQTKPLCTNLTT